MSANPGLTVLALVSGALALVGWLRWRDVAEWVGVAKPQDAVADFHR